MHAASQKTSFKCTRQRRCLARGLICLEAGDEPRLFGAEALVVGYHFETLEVGQDARVRSRGVSGNPQTQASYFVSFVSIDNGLLRGLWRAWQIIPHSSTEYY